MSQKEPGVMFYTLESHGADTGYNKHFIGWMCLVGLIITSVEWVFTMIATQNVQFIDYGWFWIVFLVLDILTWLIMLAGLVFYFIQNNQHNVIYMPGAFSMNFIMAFVVTTIAWAIKIGAQANWLLTYKGSSVAFGSSTPATYPDSSMTLQYFQFFVTYTLSEVVLFFAFAWLLVATVAHFRPVRGLGHIVMHNLSSGVAGAGPSQQQFMTTQAQFQQYHAQADMQAAAQQQPAHVVIYRSPLPNYQQQQQ